MCAAPCSQQHQLAMMMFLRCALIWRCCWLLVVVLLPWVVTVMSQQQAMPLGGPAAAGVPVDLLWLASAPRHLAAAAAGLAGMPARCLLAAAALGRVLTSAQMVCSSMLPASGFSLATAGTTLS